MAAPTTLDHDPEKAIVPHDAPHDDTTSDDSDDSTTARASKPTVDDDKAKLEAIRLANGIAGTAGTAADTSCTAGAVTRTRSHNGYGCDELAEHDADSQNPPSPSSHAESRASDGSGGPVITRTNTKDPFEVQFDRATDDPWDPRGMSTPRKWLIVALSSSGSFCVTFASSVYTSTYAQMTAEFACSHLVATLGLSTFVLGIALGPMWSPLSEFYGRRPIYLSAFAAFTLFVVPCAVATNIQTVIVTRFFQGLSGSAFLSVSGGTVGDLFRPDKMQYPMTLFTVSPFLGPGVGPLVGGFVNSNLNWRWTHYIMIIWASLMFLAIYFVVPETYRKYLYYTTSVGEWESFCLLTIITDPVVLRQKAKSIRKQSGDARWQAPIEKDQALANKSVVRTVGAALLRPFEILAFEPMALVLDIYSALILGILYLFFGAFPLVFEGVYGLNLWQTGLTFLGMLLGMCAGALTSGVWGRVRLGLIARDARRRGVGVGEGKSEPEYRLPSVMVGSALVTTGLFWFAWTTFSWVHWIVPIIGSFIFGVGVSYHLLFSSCPSLVDPQLSFPLTCLSS